MTEHVNNAEQSTQNPKTLALTLLTLPKDQAIELAEKVQASDLADALTVIRRPSELATLISLVPANAIEAVLAHDTRVYEKVKPYFENPDAYDDPQEPVAALTHDEATKLKDAGHEKWLVPVEVNALG